LRERERASKKVKFSSVRWVIVVIREALVVGLNPLKNG